MSKDLESILIVSSLYKPNVGGVETVIDRLSDQYIKFGKKVSVLTKKFPDILKHNGIV